MVLKICSLNVRGLGNKQKRKKVFEWLKSQSYSICLLQETHADSAQTKNLKHEWGSDIYVSGNSTNCEGVSILLGPKLDFNFVSYTDIVVGRLQALHLTIENKDIIFINIYGPNKDDPIILEHLNNFLLKNDEYPFVLGGDFNTILNFDLDKKNGRENNHNKYKSKLKTIIKDQNLIDIWRQHHPTKRQYTWHSNTKPTIFCRLDYFLISNDLVNCITSTQIKNGFKTDHSIVNITIDLFKKPKGVGYFKLNNSLLLENDYQELIRKTIIEISEVNKNANANTLWDIIKGSIRNVTIKYASKKKKIENQNEKKLNTDICFIESQIENTVNNEELDRLKANLDKTRNDLNVILENKINGMILRSKVEKVEFDEKNTKYFSNIEKKKSEAKIINRLKLNGDIISDTSDILNASMLFYSKLYCKKDQDESDIDFFNTSMPKLNDLEKQKCEGLLTEHECFSALKDMKNGKSPGSDGITTEFYKLFWKDIKLFLINSLNSSFQKGSLNDLQKQSYITLLPKQGKDIELLTNWRPISLLNTDYKIATKSIANRVKTILSSIISPNQTGFIKGRYIGENIRLLFEALDHAEEEHTPALLFFSDFEKAFDSLNHTFLFETLNHFNFGDSFINWIKVFYNGAKSSVINNGHVTDFFPIERGVRQGCPLSPYLFILCIELLSFNITNNINIKGIHIGELEIKSTLFADDATFLTNGTKESFENLIYTIESFTKVSGLKLNSSKCNVLRAGPLKYTNIEYLKHKKFEWSSEKAKALGICFTNNKNDILKLNLLNKVEDFNNCLKSWMHRKLTLLGKITVLKSFALPKLVYPLTVLHNPPEGILQDIINTMFRFIWNGKPNKIKKDTLIKNIESGGLKMIDLQKFIYSLKASWIKRILDDNNGPWKQIYLTKLAKYGGKTIFDCNLNPEDIRKLFPKCIFLQDVLISWREICQQDDFKVIGKCSIWNNAKVKINNKTVFYREWYDKGIIHFESIFDYRSKTFYTFDFFSYLYDISRNDYLKYYSLIGSIPSDIKNSLKEQQINTQQSESILNKLLSKKQANKFLYNYQICRGEDGLTLQQQRWSEEFSNEHFNWKVIFKSHFTWAISTKLRNFQYKYLMRIVATNKKLFKYNLANSNLCDFCSMDVETVNHLFWNCAHTQTFWSRIKQFLSSKDIDITLDLKNITFGIQDKCRYRLVLNFIIVSAKYFIYINKCKNSIPNIEGYKIYLNKCIDIEKHIALNNDKLQQHCEKWRMFLNT